MEIQCVRHFTGLHLNLNKTIVLSLHDKPQKISGVQVDNKPVKYLGTYLGTGDLSDINFSVPLQKAWNNIQSWNKRHLTLMGKVLVAKTFIVSLFVHMMNTTFLQTQQLQFIQQLLSDFIWKGHAKVKNSVAYAPILDGGLNMLHIKNQSHCLYVKWFQCLCAECGSSWSHFIWPILTEIIPVPLLQGLCSISDKILDKLQPFYATIICSYAYVNDLYYKSDPKIELPHNLWCGSLFPYIDQDWVAAGFYTVADLPVKGGRIDVIAVKQHMESVDYRQSPYFKCCALQSEYASCFSDLVVGTFVPNTELLL